MVMTNVSGLSIRGGKYKLFQTVETVWFVSILIIAHGLNRGL